MHIKLNEENSKYVIKGNCLIEKEKKRLIGGWEDSVIPDDVEIIDIYAFRDSKIEEITIPGSVKEICAFAFQDCKNLKSVKLNEGIKGIHEGAFVGTKIEQVTIPSSVEKIEGGAFVKVDVALADGNANFRLDGNCLIEVETNQLVIADRNGLIPMGTKIISKNVFYATDVASIEIPKSVEEIEDNAFRGCKKLKSVKFNEGLKKIGSSTFECSGLETVDIPSSVEHIGDSAFAGNSRLRRVTLNEGLKRIGEGAFAATGISTITVPSTVEFVGEFAFNSNKIEMKVKSKIDRSYVYKHDDKFQGLIFCECPTYWPDGKITRL